MSLDQDEEMQPMSKSSLVTKEVSSTQHPLINNLTEKTAHRGLSELEARTRFETAGPNEIQEEARRPVWMLWFDQFKSPLVLLLIGACILSGILGEWVEAIAIAAILVLNAIIGFFQEYRAETAIQALKNMTSPRAIL
jgi:P-type Ca2+ transporter type 2C